MRVRKLVEKIVIVADIQANVIALNNLNRYMKSNGLEILVNLGDLLSIGPFPKETIELLMEMESAGVEVINIEGNHDEIVRRGMDELKKVYHYSEGIIKHEIWTLNQLSENHRSYVLAFLKDFSRWGCYFTHYPRDSMGEFKPFVPQARYLTPKKQPTPNQLDSLYGSIDINQYDKLFCGHDHFGFDVISNKTKNHYLNPGSFGVGNGGKAPFYVMTVNGENKYIEKQYVEYEIQSVRDELQLRSVPEKEAITTNFFAIEN